MKREWIGVYLRLSAALLIGHPPIQNKKFQLKKKIMEDLMPLFAADSLAPHTHIHGYKMSKVSFTGQLLQKNRH